MTRRSGPTAVGSVACGLSGVCAAALVVLAALLLVVKLLGQPRGWVGADWSTVVVHLLAATVAVTAQRYADRGAEGIRALCASGVVVLTAAIFAFYWLW